MRRLFLLTLSVFFLQPLYSQQKHLLDFDDTFFKKDPYSKWMRDPFRNPPGFVKAGFSKDPWPKLDSVGGLDRVPFAVLDGKRYREGEFISEERYISSIGKNFVIITEGNFDYELVLNMSSATRVPASSPGGGR